MIGKELRIEKKRLALLFHWKWWFLNDMAFKRSVYCFGFYHELLRHERSPNTLQRYKRMVDGPTSPVPLDGSAAPPLSFPALCIWGVTRRGRRSCTGCVSFVSLAKSGQSSSLLLSRGGHIIMKSSIIWQQTPCISFAPSSLFPPMSECLPGDLSQRKINIDKFYKFLI